MARQSREGGSLESYGNVRPREMTIDLTTSNRIPLMLPFLFLTINLMVKNKKNYTIFISFIVNKQYLSK